MHINTLMTRLTPGPWTLVGRRVEGVCLPEENGRPLVCTLGELNWRANGDLIVAAPELLAGLYLALEALKDPDLKTAAIRRGLQTLARVTGHREIRPDQAVVAALSEFGVIEPTLSELALTTSARLAAGWISYAREQGLGTGFVVTQLRAGRQPPPERAARTWYTEAERKLFIIS
jgi:hypothetical protein